MGIQKYFDPFWHHCIPMNEAEWMDFKFLQHHQSQVFWGNNIDQKQMSNNILKTCNFGHYVVSSSIKKILFIFFLRICYLLSYKTIAITCLNTVRIFLFIQPFGWIRIIIAW
jgi:hypothetical protein